VTYVIDAPMSDYGLLAAAGNSSVARCRIAGSVGRIRGVGHACCGA
jgi:hypothetical protein